MRTMLHLSFALLLAVGMLAPMAAATADETFAGKISCAKCHLKKAGVTECQDILTVTDAKGMKTEYWLVKNEATGHQCSGEVEATVTGTVAEKDGQKWLTASKVTKK
ncbi:MAG: DUF6370 family protein [Acidobacteriota bacterium]